jgi:hypothetical protein
MRWQRNWSDRPKSPKARKPFYEEKEAVLTAINNGIKSSPVLSALNIRAKSSRGRFYYERTFSDSGTFNIGRVTPLQDTGDNFLLEVEYGKGQWKQIAKGKIRTITNSVSSDKLGTFHGLGELDKSIRRAKKQGLEKLKMKKDDGLSFSYLDSDEKCTVQEILFPYFDVPILIISEPRQWYAYHRTPHIREIENKDKILVDFMSYSIDGGGFGGKCLYIKRNNEWNNEWNAYGIRPNQSETIKSSVLWLEKRKWKGW